MQLFAYPVYCGASQQQPLKSAHVTQARHFDPARKRAGWLAFEAQTQDTRPDKKNYRLTPAGHAELLRWLGEPVQPNTINDALLVKLYAGAHTSPDNLREEMQRHIAVHRKTLDSLLSIERDYHGLPAEQRHTLRMPYLTLRRGILGEQSWLQWAEEVEHALQDTTPASPPPGK